MSLKGRPGAAAALAGLRLPRAQRTRVSALSSCECSAASVQAPDLATDGRLRPSRFKPREEQELEEMSQHPAFHALPLK